MAHNNKACNSNEKPKRNSRENGEIVGNGRVELPLENRKQVVRRYEAVVVNVEYRKEDWRQGKLETNHDGQ